MDIAFVPLAKEATARLKAASQYSFTNCLYYGSTKAINDMKPSSPGYDDIPAWFYKLFANEVGLVVSKIFNTSVVNMDKYTRSLADPLPDLRQGTSISTTMFH